MHFVQFYNMIETQFGVKVKMVRSDNDTEFINDFCHDFFLFPKVFYTKSPLSKAHSKMV